MPAEHAAPTHLLYLHGFRSSPKSFKAQQLAAWLLQHQPGITWWCPQLPPSPQQAMALVRAGIQHWPQAQMAVLGSSLGGFYATWLAEHVGCPAVVMNPAVDPARDLAAYIGEQAAFHTPEERFFFRPEFIEELRQLHAGPLTAVTRYLAVIAKGDELLDWREMCGRYAGAQQLVLEGGDHALTDFDSCLPRILQHLQLAR